MRIFDAGATETEAVPQGSVRTPWCLDWVSLKRE